VDVQTYVGTDGHFRPTLLGRTRRFDLKTDHVTLTTPIREQSVIESQALNIFYLHTKFGDCRFSRSGYMIAGIEIEKWVT